MIPSRRSNHRAGGVVGWVVGILAVAALALILWLVIAPGDDALEGAIGDDTPVAEDSLGDTEDTDVVVGVEDTSEPATEEDDLLGGDEEDASELAAEGEDVLGADQEDSSELATEGEDVAADEEAMTEDEADPQAAQQDGLVAGGGEGQQDGAQDAQEDGAQDMQAMQEEIQQGLDDARAAIDSENADQAQTALEEVQGALTSMAQNAEQEMQEAAQAAQERLQTALDAIEDENWDDARDALDQISNDLEF